jgi:hypothetical protein
MIYENTYNINEAFNRNGQSAMFCDHFLHFSHKTTLCFLIKDYHIRTINIMECHALGHFAKSRNLAFLVLIWTSWKVRFFEKLENLAKIE